jgi:hypothetical protein
MGLQCRKRCRDQPFRAGVGARPSDGPCGDRSRVCGGKVGQSRAAAAGLDRQTMCEPINPAPPVTRTRLPFRSATALSRHCFESAMRSIAPRADRTVAVRGQLSAPLSAPLPPPARSGCISA